MNASPLQCSCLWDYQPHQLIVRVCGYEIHYGVTVTATSQARKVRIKLLQPYSGVYLVKNF